MIRIAGAQLMEAVHDLALHQPDVLVAVAQRDLVVVGEPRRQPNERQIVEAAQRSVETFGTFGMVRTGEMFLRSRVRNQRRHYLPYSSS